VAAGVLAALTGSALAAWGQVHRPSSRGPMARGLRHPVPLTGLPGAPAVRHRPLARRPPRRAIGGGGSRGRRAVVRAASSSTTPVTTASSGSAYAGESAGEAWSTDTQTFPAPFKMPVPEPLHLRAGERALHLGDHYAVVAQPDGHRYVARSIGTVSYDSPQGRVPVSLALKDRGSDVGPEHSPADVSFPKKGSDRFFFSGGGFGVSVDTAQPASAQMQGGKMFYPNALPDTDVLAVPTSRGLDTYGVVRSAKGPEALVLRFDLPAGGALVEHSDPEGTTVALTRDGKPLASIAPPQAQDAQGVPVPVSYKVEGDRLVVRVTHRSKGYAYPIMIDPSISESAHWRQDGSADYNGFVDEQLDFGVL